MGYNMAHKSMKTKIVLDESFLTLLDYFNMRVYFCFFWL